MLCEKPMTVTVEEAEDIVATAKRTGILCAVNYGYSGYALVRHMRAMVARGDLGKVRLIKAEFAHGFHADAADLDNPRVRWRYDPAQAGISGAIRRLRHPRAAHGELRRGPSSRASFPPISSPACRAARSRTTRW